MGEIFSELNVQKILHVKEVKQNSINEVFDFKIRENVEYLVKTNIFQHFSYFFVKKFKSKILIFLFSSFDHL